MPTGVAYSSRHLVQSHLRLAYVLLVETNPFPERVFFLSDYTLRTSLGTLSIFLNKTIKNKHDAFVVSGKVGIP